MKLELLKGSFNKTEAIEILTRLVAIKIQFHEGKITNSDREEDIKMRENRIKELQKEINEVRRKIQEGSTEQLQLSGAILVSDEEGNA